ncbi:MAG: hypothetical protein NTV32_10795, partial [Gammaproteobacteria bacterium]|nr:hypothetical protein [Gammaproteobacteria bacterium]
MMDEIMTALTQGHPDPKDASINEVEFSVVGYRKTGQDSYERDLAWNIPVGTFNQILRKVKNKYDRVPVKSQILTISPADEARAKIKNYRARLYGDTTARIFCATDRLPNRAADSEEYTIEKKERYHRNRVDLYEYGLRLSFSRETPGEDMYEEFNSYIQDKGTTKIYRYMQRYSVVVLENINGDNTGSLSVDFTCVRQGPGKYFRQAYLIGATSRVAETYEIEIELQGLKGSTIAGSDVMLALRGVLQTILSEMNGGLGVSKTSTKLAGLNGYLALCSKCWQELG